MDADALAAYTKYADEMVRFASAIVGPSGADDVAANALTRVLTGDAWRSARNLRAFLFRSVVNEARSQHRSTQRRLAREVRQSRSDRPAEPSVRIEVLDAIRRLTERQRAVVYLTYWLDHAPIEIAEVLGVSMRTVERELTVARRRLEVLLR